MNKQAFNARARVGRALARVARMSHDGWAYDQAKEYARTGYIGPDLGAYLLWYWQGGDFPRVSLGSSRRADQLFNEVNACPCSAGCSSYHRGELM